MTKAFVKPHELIDNKAAMPVPFTGQVRVINTRLIGGGKDPIRDIPACGQGTGG